MVSLSNHAFSQVSAVNVGFFTRSLAGPSEPQRPTGDFAVIQTGRAIELRDDRRQLRAKPPLVGTAAGRFERVAPPIPPAGDEAGERLDDQHAIAAAGALDKVSQQRLTRRI